MRVTMKPASRPRSKLAIASFVFGCVAAGLTLLAVRDWQQESSILGARWGGYSVVSIIWAALVVLALVLGMVAVLTPSVRTDRRSGALLALLGMLLACGSCVLVARLIGLIGGSGE